MNGNLQTDFSLAFRNHWCSASLMPGTNLSLPQCVQHGVAACDSSSVQTTIMA